MGVSILPGNSRTPWDLIGQMTGQNISQNLPGAVQQGYQRQQGLNAIDQLQNDLAQSGGDISKMLPAIARAYTLNPNLERSGIAEHALRQAKVGAAYGGQQPGMGIGQQQPQQMGSPSVQQPIENQTAPAGTFAKPSPFNVMTPQDMQNESTRYANAIGDPNAYQKRYNEL